MIVDKITLLNGLLGMERRQFIIPIYQRKYKWTSEQCNRLIDDIINAGEKQKEHFVGTVIYKAPTSGSFIRAFLVDGQQRVTTVLLMIKALNMISSEKKDLDNNYEYVYNSTSGKIYADKNDYSQGMKLLPSKNDEKTFNAIMKAKSFDEIQKNPLIEKNEDDFLYNNFKTIYNRFLKLDKSGEYLRNVLYEGLLLQGIVEMSLGVDDDAQAIFESINSLGLKLSNADLIRNYLLMSHEKQKELYEKYWEIIQDSYIKENNMEDFVFNYLMMKKSYAINNDDVYKEYVQFARDEFNGGEIDQEQLLIDLYNVAKIYQPFIRNTSNYSTDTNMLMQELRDMDQSTAYPFLMKVFLDKENNIIDEAVLDKVINLIIVYLVRRFLCSVPTNSLRGFMLNLYNRVFKIEKNKERYYESIYAFLTQLQTTDRMRTLDEVQEALKTLELYKNRKMATYLLYKIENGRYPKVYPEFTLASSVSIEHIMPQTLTDDWISMLGANAEDIHRIYLNTLGNLSLSSRSKNSIMSNEDFIIKRDILKTAGSKFIELNQDIKADQTEFTLTEIEDREQRLATIVCDKYDLGDIDVSGIKFEDSVEVVCSTDYEDVFTSTTPLAYKLFDKEYTVDSFSRIIVGVAKILLEKYPEKIRELAKEKFNPWDGGTLDTIHYTYDENDKDQLIGEDIRVHTNYSAVYSVQFITILMEKVGVEASQLIIYIKKDSIKTENILPKKERIKMVRNSLKELADEEKLIYVPENMPKSDEWIKFQTEELNTLFKYDDVTKWDGEDFPHISYLEYQLSTNTIILTYKLMKKTRALANMLMEHKDELGISEDIPSTYWHIKKYKVDYKFVCESKDKNIAMKNQIEAILLLIKEDLRKMSEIIE